MANDDDKIIRLTVQEIETSFVGHAGEPYCEVWITTDKLGSLSLRFSLKIAEQFASTISNAAILLKQRTHN